MGVKYDDGDCQTPMSVLSDEIMCILKNLMEEPSLTKSWYIPT